MLLTFHENIFSAEATTREGEFVGVWIFDRVGSEGRVLDIFLDDTEVVAVRVSESKILEPWQDQGITERVIMLVSDEMGLSFRRGPPTIYQSH